MTLLFTWNDIIWPLIVLLDTTRYPIAIGVLSFSRSSASNYGVTFAGYVLASLPLIIVFFLTVRRFMAGLKAAIGSSSGAARTDTIYRVRTAHRVRTCF